jgi:RHS repeat-associated protein
VGETSIASFTYTPTGQLETVTDNRGVTSYSYDELGRLLSRTDPDGPYLTSGASIEYGYDAAGNRTSVTTPTGTVEYAFDSQNRLKTVTDDAGVTSYSYNDVGNLIRTELPNGVVETRTYDELSRLESVSYVKDGTLIASYDYTLDPVGHRRVVEERDGRQVEYEYDDLYRLTRETIADPVNGNRTIEYTYDAVGNRLSRIDSVEGTTTYVYDGNDRLVREELIQDGGLVHTYEYRYDDNGNTIERVEKDKNSNVIGNATYSWDKENRLVGVTTSTGDVISYEYDTDNIRVSSTVNGVTTEYLVDKNRPYAEVLSEYVDDAVAVNYLHGLDLISQERNGSESFYLVDGLGSTRLLTDEGGEVTNTYSYDAFGNLVASSGSIENDYRFAGEQYDENLERYYLRQRYYDAGIGRFTRRDTYEGRLGNPVTLHKYLYANGNPVNYVDPSGFFASIQEITISQQVGAILAATGLTGIVVNSGPPEYPGGFGEGPQPSLPNHTGHTPQTSLLRKLLSLGGFGAGSQPDLPSHTGRTPDRSLRRLIRYIFATSSGGFEELAFDIAYGHAWNKEGRQFEWSQLGISNRDELAERIYDILTSPMATKVRGNTTIYLGIDGTIVFDNPIDPDGGTAFNPNIQQGRDGASIEVFNALEGVEQEY